MRGSVPTTNGWGHYFSPSNLYLQKDLVPGCGLLATVFKEQAESWDLGGLGVIRLGWKSW